MSENANDSAAANASEAVRIHKHRNRKANFILLGLAVVLVVLAVTSFLVGRYPISPDKVVAILEARDGTILDVVRKIKPYTLDEA